MATKEDRILLKDILKEVRDVREHLSRLLLVIPEESLKEYAKENGIRKSFNKATRHYPPK